MGGPQQEIAYAVAVDGDGGVITVGTFNLTADLDPGAGITEVTSNGSSDIFIQKLDASGAFVWGLSLGAGGADLALGVATDDDDNIVVTGRVNGIIDLDPTAGVDLDTTAGTSFDVFVIKLTGSGGYLWGRLFGGISNDAGNSIAVDGSGNIITVGYIGNTSDLDPGPGVSNAGGNGMQDAFVQKMDADGNFLWGRSIGGTANDIAHGLAVDADNAILVTGEFRNTIDLDPGPGVVSRLSNGADDIFVFKLDAAGELQWGHAIGGTGSERARALAVGPDGGPVVTGRVTSVADFDPGPAVFSLPGSNFEQAFVLKLTGAGEFAWAFLLASFLNEGLGVDVDLLNNIYVTGFFGSTMDIDPGPGTTNITSNGGGDMFLLSYDAQGELLWGTGLGGAQSDISHAVAITPVSNILIAGEFRQTVDMEPGAGTTLMTNAGGQDAFTAQYDKPDCSGVFVQLKALLDGAYPGTGDLMNDHLRTAGLIPLEEPYSAMGFSLSEPAATTPEALSWSLSNGVVDWVLVELRDPNNPSNVLSRKAALIQRDGDVVSTDGVSPVGFCLAEGPYMIALRHRNHLGVMTADAVELSATPVAIDLRAELIAVYGTDARRSLNGHQLLWAGNVLPDVTVSYTGATNDRDPILARIGGLVPTNVVDGYWPEDVNLNGQVKYAGTENDRDRVLVTIGGVIPTSTRSEQLP